MSKKANNSVTVAAAVSAAIDFLNRAASATKVASDATKAVQDQRMGAYTLYVKAAIAAANAENFLTAANTVEAEIKRTGQAGGKPCGSAKATGEGKEGFTVPMSFSAAKSYMGKALANSVPLTEKDKKGKVSERSYNAIRNDVMALVKGEREALEAEKLAKGPESEQVRMGDGRRVIAELTDLLFGEKKIEDVKDMRDLIARVDDAMTNYGFESEADEVVTLVTAAAPKRSKARKATAQQQAAA